MKGYTEKVLFSEGAKVCLEMANKIIDYIDHEWNKDDQLRCHEVARICQEIIVREFPLIKVKVVDGLFGRIDHSWLVIARRFLLDVYCIGQLPQVKLLHPDIFGIDLDDSYSERGERTDIDEQLVEKMVKDIISLDGNKDRAFMCSLIKEERCLNQ